MTHCAVGSVGAHEVADARGLLATVSVAQPGAHPLGVSFEAEQLDWPLDLSSETFQVLLQHPFRFRLRDKKQEEVGCVVNAYIAELQVRCRTPLDEGCRFDRAPPPRYQLVSDAHLLQEL